MDGELARTTFRPLRPHRIYRVRLERDGQGMRLMTRGGYNFADRYPWIVRSNGDGPAPARPSMRKTTLARLLARGGQSASS